MCCCCCCCCDQPPCRPMPFAPGLPKKRHSAELRNLKSAGTKLFPNPNRKFQVYPLVYIARANCMDGAFNQGSGMLPYSIWLEAERRPEVARLQAAILGRECVWHTTRALRHHHTLQAHSAALPPPPPHTNRATLSAVARHLAAFQKSCLGTRFS